MGFKENKNVSDLKSSGKKRKSNMFTVTDYTGEEKHKRKKPDGTGSTMQVLVSPAAQGKARSKKKGKEKTGETKKVKQQKSVRSTDNEVSLLLNKGENFDDLLDFGSERGEVVGQDGNSDGEDDGPESQEKFLESMASLDGKKKRVAVNRGEDTGPVDENRIPVSDRVELSDLLKNLDSDTRKVAQRISGKKKTKKSPGNDNVGSTGTLSTPLEKPAADRVVREAGYGRVRKEVGVWDAVVHSRRAADTLHFPLNRPDMKLETADEVVKSRYAASSTPLEEQIAALLAGSKAVPKPGQDGLSEIERRGLEGLTPRELAARRNELAKFRALQTYQEAKMRRQNKIKSKKFRKIARKEKSKEKLKELEQLALTDPEAAAEQLEQLDRRRIEERASLKHRNASKFLQEQSRRAKATNDKDVRAVVAEQIQKHRDILAKPKNVSDDDDDDEDDEALVDIQQNLDTAQLQNSLLSESSTFGEFSAQYRKYHAEQEDRKQKQATSREEEEEDMEDMFEEAEANIKERVLRKIEEKRQGLSGKKKDDSEEGQEMGEGEDDLAHAESLKFPSKKPESLPKKLAAGRASKDKLGADDVDPNNFLTLEAKPLGMSDLPEIVGYNEEDAEADADETSDQRATIAEAFAEDDVLADFRAEKAALVEASKPKAIDLTLPGWGDWVGGGLAPSKRKRRRFTVRAPPPERRRDENRGNLILNVDKDERIRAHKVSNVPFPFTSVSDFEASIRAPVGDTFLPRTAFLKMIKPKVQTKMGEAIQPMDRSQLVKRGIEAPLEIGGGL